MTERICAIHQVPIITEPGGPDMPTIHGRTYCPQCQSDMNAALDKINEQEPIDHALEGRLAKAERERYEARQLVTEHLHAVSETRLEFITDLLKHLREEHRWSDDDDRWMSPMRALQDFHDSEHGD